MKAADLTPGTTYVGRNGTTRRLVRFLDSRRRKGAADSVAYVQVTGRGASDGERVMLRRSFARFAVERVEDAT